MIFAILIAYLIYRVISCVLSHIRNRWRVGEIGKEVESLAVDIMANVNDSELSDEEEPGKFYVPGASVGRFQARIICMTKAEFPCIAYSRANELMVQKHLRDLMIERGMRKIDIARAIPIATTMVFVPDDSQILARKLAASSEVQARHSLYNALWLSRQSWWSALWQFVLGLFGLARTDSSE